MARGDAASMAPERRRQLLRTAAREFAEAGYERASLNRVIKACGMSKSSFYHYLDSKEALFDLVVSEASAAMVDALAIPTPAELAVADADYWDRIAQLLDQLLTLDEAEWFEDFGRMFHLADAPPMSSLSKLVADIHAWVQESLEVGRGRAVVRDDLPTTLQTQLVLAVLTMMDRWSLTHRPSDPATRERIATAQFDALRRLLDPAVGNAGQR